MKFFTGIVALLAITGNLIAQPARLKTPTQNLPRIVAPIAKGESPMRTHALSAKAHISGLQVEVTTTITFYNPNSRILEGELQFPLPDGAVVTGYALDINGLMIDGVVVKKEEARVAFEEETRRRVDPGIVEHTAGNLYRTRIYPLPAKGERKIQLKYVSELPANQQGDVAWHLPMPVGEKIGKISLRMEVEQTPVKPEIGGFGNLRFESLKNIWVAQTQLTNATPGEDVWVALPKIPALTTAIERDKDGEVYFAISDLPPKAAKRAAPSPRHLGIAFDASGSRGGDHLQKEFATLTALLSNWQPTDITVLVFRDRVQTPGLVHTAAELVSMLNLEPLDGGTDLSALAQVIRENKQIDEWLLLTDGMDTLSDQLPDFGNKKVTALISQAIGQRELLRQACTASGGTLIDLQRLSPAEAAIDLANPGARLAAVQGTGVAELQGLGTAATGRVSVHGKLTAEKTPLTLEFSDGSKSSPVVLERKNAVEGHLIASVWAAHRVNQLAVRAEENGDELLALGRQFGIVSPVTSLIVLENVDQYVRHDIEPPASQPEWRRQWAERKSWMGKDNRFRENSRSEAIRYLWENRSYWWDDSHTNQIMTSPKVVPTGLASTPPPSPTRSAARAARPIPGTTVIPSPTVAEEEVTITKGARHEIASSRSEAPVHAAPIMATDSAVALESKQALSDVDTGSGGARSAGLRERSKPITIKPWDPKTPYLAEIKTAPKAERYRVYLSYRKTYDHSPGFFVDCADYFLREGDVPTGSRILSNLGEMRLGDAGMLRIMGWRFQQAGDLDHAVALLRKAGKLRTEEPQSCRDLALALAERGKVRQNPADLREALDLFHKTIIGNWRRDDEIKVIALEEFNALTAWVKKSPMAAKLTIPQMDTCFQSNHDVDLRIVMSWDTDATDIDLHVIEPGGEEAFYSHNLTTINGMVSRDITDGYGPEEYMLKHAKPGVYKVCAHYYGSRQQTLFGPSTVTATIFTDFGRPNEKKQTMTLRLDQPKDSVEIGSIRIGGGNEKAEPTAQAVISRDTFLKIRIGQTPDEITRLVGKPQKTNKSTWTYKTGDRSYEVKFTEKNGVQTVREVTSGGVILILVQ